MTTATVTPSKSGKPAKFRRDHKINWWLTAAVAVLSLTILIPLYFTIVTALKTPAEAGTFALPTSWQWHNFADASAKVNYPKAALNSAIITVARRGAHPADQHLRGLRRGPQHGQALLPLPVLLLHRRHVRAVPGRHAADCEADGSLHLDNQVGLIILYTVLGLGTNLFIATGFIRSIPVSLGRSCPHRWRIHLAHLLDHHLPADEPD